MSWGSVHKTERQLEDEIGEAVIKFEKEYIGRRVLA